MSWGRPVAKVVLVTAGVLIAVTLADSDRRLWDLTAGSTLSLTSQTRDIVEAVDRDIEITAFIRRDEPGRVEAVTLLDRYRRLNRRIDVDVRDPDESPGELNRLGVDPVSGGLAIRTRDRVELVPFATEGDITGALARLIRPEVVTVCVTTGHGERDTRDRGFSGMSEAAALLERDGYEISTPDLLAEPTVPGSCDVLLMANPVGSLSEAAEEAVDEWVDDDGRLLLLTDPTAEDVPVAETLESFHLTVERGVVFEGDSANIVSGDVSAPIVTRYVGASPVVRGLAPTFFPVVQEIVVEEGATLEGLSASGVAQTSRTSYLERDPLEAAFDPADDRGGPITVVAVADRSRVQEADVRRSRIVVTGDVDFASNNAIGEAGNAQLLRQAVAWLSETEDLVAISPNIPKNRPLRLTDARADYALVLLAGVIPGLFLLAGAMVWAVRRTR